MKKEKFNVILFAYKNNSSATVTVPSSMKAPDTATHFPFRIALSLFLIVTIMAYPLPYITGTAVNSLLKKIKSVIFMLYYSRCPPWCCYWYFRPNVLNLSVVVMVAARSSSRVYYTFSRNFCLHHR